ncbi:sterile alpha motif domain-containing protein 3-like [Astyanax mexicanus]|uniref:Sterile alpha motif domain-containing protein 3-like n=1 Tax=Astyanax mexicanus TaxID=7994 RepID=A0A8T2L913_ASTMX|nr:sterile alpha motif domain-containing protein 3-like [Astyanax mexicanus]
MISILLQSTNLEKSLWCQLRDFCFVDVFQVKMLLRVVLSPNDIRKISISTPSSVEELVTVLCEKLQIERGFVLQYEDPDFNYELCNLNDISELPPDKATLRLHCKSPSTRSSTSDSATACDSDQVSSCMSRSDQWPSQFPIPSFSYDVELRLQKANEEFKNNGTHLNVTRDIKMHVLEKLAEAVYSYKAYPKDSELEKVACALVDKNPCLKAPGSGGGWEGWKLSLKFKMANYRQKLRYAGCPEIEVNFRQGSSRLSLKRPRRSELNFLPEHPVGFSEEALERDRAFMEEEVKKKDMKLSVLNSKMDVTFSLRRKEIVQDQPLVSTVKQRWPGLFIEEQVYAEFQRINCIDLKSTFLTSLDSHTRGLLKMYRAKANQGKGREMEALLENLDCQVA